MSHGADNSEVAEDIEMLLDPRKLTIICGDFNLCYIEQRTNCILNKLEGCGFTQLVTEATHIKGGHIDQVWSNHDRRIYQVDVALYSPYYLSDDHDAICVTIRKSPR